MPTDSLHPWHTYWAMSKKIRFNILEQVKNPLLRIQRKG